MPEKEQYTPRDYFLAYDWVIKHVGYSGVLCDSVIHLSCLRDPIPECIKDSIERLKFPEDCDKPASLILIPTAIDTILLGLTEKGIPHYHVKRDKRSISCVADVRPLWEDAGVVLLLARGLRYGLDIYRRIEAYLAPEREEILKKLENPAQALQGEGKTTEKKGRIARVQEAVDWLLRIRGIWQILHDSVNVEKIKAILGIIRVDGPSTRNYLVN